MLQSPEFNMYANSRYEGSQVVEAWTNLLFSVEGFMERVHRTPVYDSPDDSERALATWLGAQRRNYIRKVCAMSNTLIREKWETACGRYPLLAW